MAGAMYEAASQPSAWGPRPGTCGAARFALTAIIAAALASGGCGTSVQQHQVRYLTQLRAIDASFNVSVRRLLSEVTPASKRPQTSQAVGRFERELANVEARLRALHAPAEAARRHRHMVRAIDRYATRLRLEVKALRFGSARALARSGRGMLTATRSLSTDVNATSTSIERMLAGSGGGSGG
jgi:hypothetical protein